MQELNVFDTVAVDDDDAIARLGPVDAVVDTVGGAVAAKLFAKVKEGGQRHGKFKLPISQRLPLAEAAHGHALMERGGAGKIILVIE